MTLRAATVPALTLAYPVAYVLLSSDQYCEPVCVDPTLRGGLILFGSVLLCAVAGIAIARGLSLTARFEGRPIPEEIAHPSLPSIAVVVVVFVGFVAGVATLESGVLEFSPAPFLLSLALYPVVWLGYALTVPLSLVFATGGADPGSVGTLTTRTVILGVGFGLSVVWHLLLVQASSLFASVHGVRTPGQ
ncbi:hypothetical protein [Halobiforma nitratireducens]|uniref:Uncharacterized protein n=1 Tax=Halobiforma nitratireducens JCM 10879 TaxID=1227454 RepID=M0MPD5_9EURY|nr:hypothetical protein [Halobiforma nitratireducens]EMA46584.1 hypothetical protein C446_01026 [Halobiforma nitratireducens JCM 10879]